MHSWGCMVYNFYLVSFSKYYQVDKKLKFRFKFYVIIAQHSSKLKITCFLLYAYIYIIQICFLFSPIGYNVHEQTPDKMSYELIRT